MTTTANATPAPVRPNLILGICCMSLLIMSMDVTIVNVALPTIQRELHASLSGLQWVVDAYTLVLASLLMLSGSLADRLGRRRVFQLGLGLFTAGSVLCSLAPNIGSLVAARAFQGVGASMLNPVALSIIVNAFPDKKARAGAIGIWGAVAGVSFALGPIVGGALTQALGWRWNFWINLPIGLLAITLAALFVPESKSARARRFDPVGQLLLIAVLASVTFAVIEGQHRGWQSPLIVGLFTGAAVLFAGFLWYEPRRQEPLVDLRFFRSIPFTSSTVIAVCAFASFAAFLFLNALYLQQVRGFSALHTGLSTLPLALMMVFCAPLSGRLVGSYGARPSLLSAGVGFMLGTGILTALSSATPVWLLLVSYALLGIGLGMVNPAIANNAVAGMPLSQAGVAAAILSTSRQVGAAFGVAIAGSVIAARRAGGLDFTHATHPLWWGMFACGALVLTLGWASNTDFAKKSTAAVAYLLQD